MDSVTALKNTMCSITMEDHAGGPSPENICSPENDKKLHSI